MIRAALSCVFVVALSGCATLTSIWEGSRPQAAENFAVSAPPAAQTRLARQSADQLATLYAPAKTHLTFTAIDADPFGTALVAALRSKGFAVSTGAENKEATPRSAGALPASYILDQAGDSLYRFRLKVGSASLARAYVAQGGQLVPAGNWVRTEVAQ